jgi:AraC family transcriptional regulator
MNRILAALGLVFLLGVDAATPALPSFDTSNWRMTGSNPSGYNGDRVVDAAGIATITIKANSQANADTFGTLAYKIDATKYQGTHVAVAGMLSTAAATSGRFWMRVDDAGGKALQFDNMANRALQGDTTWTPFQIVLDVPSNGKTIYLGLLLVGTGSASARNVRLGTVAKDAPTTNSLPQL